MHPDISLSPPASEEIIDLVRVHGLTKTLDTVERVALNAILSESTSKTAAAEVLGILRPTFLFRLQKYGLMPKSKRRLELDGELPRAGAE